MKTDIEKEPKKLIVKPPWIENFENRIASSIHVHPNIISAAKLFIITPLLLLAFKQTGVLPPYPWIIIMLFLSFGILDYWDGVVARQKELETVFGRIFARVTDYPVLLIISIFCINIIPVYLLFLKLLLDLILIVLNILGLENTENRARTGINYITLFTLLIVSQGWTHGLININLAISLLLINILFSAVVILYNTGILQKRFIADALSGCNLLCGIFSMIFAYRHRIDISLLLLMLGAAFDGFDGAAARKFGGTRFGIFSDDIADGINYGIAPGAALYFTLSNIDGLIIGIVYSVFTIGRLIYFILNKNNSDPNYFCGVPSTVGGLVILSSIILFKGHLVILGLMAGIACIQMVSFDTHYRHLGRALASNRRIIYGMPVMILVLIIGNLLAGKNLPVAIILGASLIYGFLPTITHFIKLIKNDATL